MPGFSTTDAIVNAFSVNLLAQRLQFDKLMASVSVANTPHTMWKATGIPVAGADPTLGAANGRTPTSATAGAYTYTNATGPATMHEVTLGAASKVASTTGSLLMCDRLSDIQLTHVQATTALTGLDGTSRLGATTAPGDGGQLWTEVTSGFSAAANVKTFTYTNMVGTGSQVTPSFTTIASAVVGRSANANLWQSLATGDTGIRSIQTQTHSSGTATGQLNYVLVRPLGYIPLTAVATWVERDFVVEIPNLPKLFDSSCIFFIYVPTAAVTGSIFGEFRMCQN